MGDYFDEDDLINDYVEDYPPDDDLNDGPQPFDELSDDEKGKNGATNGAAFQKAGAYLNTPNAVVPPLKDDKMNRGVSISQLQRQSPDKQDPPPPVEEVIMTSSTPNDADDLSLLLDRTTGTTSTTKKTSSSSLPIDDESPDEWRRTTLLDQSNFGDRKRKRDLIFEAYKARHDTKNKGTTKKKKNVNASIRLIHYARQNVFSSSNIVHSIMSKSVKYSKSKTTDTTQRYTVPSKQKRKYNNNSHSITLPGQKGRIFVRTKEPEIRAVDTDTSKDLLNGRIPLSLLEGPNVKELLKRIQKKERRRKATTPLHQEEEETLLNKGFVTAHGQQRQLWVDKHAPKTFAQLLSDERTNREVLRCIREWDPYVFGRDPPARPAAIVKRMEETKRLHQNSSTPKVEQQPTVPNANPRDKRPPLSSRVILLCGPPGIGKTTLAHVLSHHAGYQPMEINASDDRTASVLMERIVQSMENNSSLLRKTSRPTCLILDEFDGAHHDRSTVQKMLDLIRAELPTLGDVTEKVNSQRKRRQRNGTSSKPFLRRPIILIANQKYSLVVRPLLPYMRVFDVSPPSDHRLVSRLQAILMKETLQKATCPFTTSNGHSQSNSNTHSTKKALYSLVSSSDCDIRSCLNTLQFVLGSEVSGSGSRGPDYGKTLAARLVTRGSAQKDERAELVETVRSVFRKNNGNAATSSSIGSHQKTNERGSSRFNDAKSIQNVMEIVESFNDASTALDLVFTNIPIVPYSDLGLDRSVTAYEWLSSADALGHAGSMQAPVTAAAVHLLCRVETPNQLNTVTPSLRQLKEARFRREHHCHMLESWYTQDLPMGTRRCFATSEKLRTELLPFVSSSLLQSDDSALTRKSVSSLELLNDLERTAFWDHVRRLRALGLTYAKKPHTDGGGGHYYHQPIMKLEPEIDGILCDVSISDGDTDTTNSFPNRARRKPKGVSDLPPSLLELLAHEAEVQRIKERENLNLVKAKEKANTEVSESNKGRFKSNRNVDSIQKKKDPQVGEKRERINLLSESNNKIPKKTFFGSKKKRSDSHLSSSSSSSGNNVKVKIKLTHTGTGIPLNQAVRFKFQKGYTQAVRTPCKIDDLL